MWLPARNPATGTTSPSQSMTDAMTGGIIPRVADAFCGSSPELPHFLSPARIRIKGRVASPRMRAGKARDVPLATAGKRFGRARIFPAMTRLYKKFFLLHNFLDLKKVPLPVPRKCHICASHRHSRDALRSNPILGRVAFFLSLPLTLPRAPPSRPLRHVAERAMIPDLPGNAAPARPVPGSMYAMPPA